MAKKITVQGNYQYSEADSKKAMLLHSFGWLIGRRTEHENRKGEKVFTIRRDLEIAADPIVKKAEKKFNKFYYKAKKKMTCRHRWGQFFAILFTILGLVAGGALLAAGFVEAIGDIINPVIDSVKEMVPEAIPADIADMVFEYLPYGFLGIGAISLISIFINKGRYKKRMATPKKNYAKKYNLIAQNAVKEASERVYALKADNKYLMTRNDRKLADLGATFQRVMDRNVDEYE